MIPIPRIELSAATLKLIVGIACALALALLVHDRNRWKAAAVERQYRLEAERTAHAGTIGHYRAAAERARAADRANAERVTAEQAAINERTADDYEKRLAAARAAAAERLRVRASAGDPGAGRAAPVSAISAATGGAAETARQDRFSVPEDERARTDRGSLGLEDALTATEQAIQLDELIKWVRRQAAVDVNGAAGAVELGEPPER